MSDAESRFIVLNHSICRNQIFLNTLTRIGKSRSIFLSFDITATALCGNNSATGRKPKSNKCSCSQYRFITPKDPDLVCLLFALKTEFVTLTHPPLPSMNLRNWSLSYAYTSLYTGVLSIICRSMYARDELVSACCYTVCK